LPLAQILFDAEIERARIIKINVAGGEIEVLRGFAPLCTGVLAFLRRSDAKAHLLKPKAADRPQRITSGERIARIDPQRESIASAPSER